MDAPQPKIPRSRTGGSGSGQENFVQNLTNAQPRLFGYILSLLPNSDAAMDVLQETNLVLWRKSSEFVGGQFLTWACSVARFQVMAFRRDMAREKKVFSDEVVEAIARDLGQEQAALDQMQAALDQCLQKLPPRERELVNARYGKGGSVTKLAREYQKTANAISRSLYRLRAILLNCVEQAIPAEEMA